MSAPDHARHRRRRAPAAPPRPADDRPDLSSPACLLIAARAVLQGNPGSSSSRSAGRWSGCFRSIIMFLVTVDHDAARAHDADARAPDDAAPLEARPALGYGIAFAIVAAVQAVATSIVAFAILGVDPPGSTVAVAALAVSTPCRDVAGAARQRLRRTEFQVDPVHARLHPAAAAALRRVRAPRHDGRRARGDLHALPMSYAFEALQKITVEGTLGSAGVVDVVVTVGAAVRRWCSPPGPCAAAPAQVELELLLADPDLVAGLEAGALAAPRSRRSRAAAARGRRAPRGWRGRGARPASRPRGRATRNAVVLAHDLEAAVAGRRVDHVLDLELGLAAGPRGAAGRRLGGTAAKIARVSSSRPAPVADETASTPSAPSPSRSRQASTAPLDLLGGDQVALRERRRSRAARSSPRAVRGELARGPSRRRSSGSPASPAASTADAGGRAPGSARRGRGTRGRARRPRRRPRSGPGCRRARAGARRRRSSRGPARGS